MKEKLNRFSLYLLFSLTGLTLVSNKKIIAEVGKKISLPCAVSKNGDITWNKDGALFAKKGRMGLAYGKVSGSERFSIASGATYNLETANVQLSDSGTFTCAMVGAVVKTVELVVFEVSAEPSGTLITSENLKLSVKSSPVVESEVSWLKDGVKITDGVDLEVKNITIEQSGDYVCHIKMKDGVEAHFSKSISVKGLKSSPAIVYMSRKKSVTLPFMFNFNVKESPLQDDIGVVEGDVKYLSNPPKTVQSLVVSSGAACWSLKCQPKMDPQDLNLSITSPRSGLYQMEIFLQIGGRKKRLHKDVCVANLTVSTSHNNIVTEGNVTLLCGINCIDKDGRLCWRHTNRSYDICGPPGKDNLAKEITVLQETSGNWTCGVFTGENRLTSANLTLEIPLGFLDLSNALFWVTVVAGVIVFLIIVTILTVIIARHRRVRRARYRAWLLENLHHHRRCECDYKGFAPQRLRQNI